MRNSIKIGIPLTVLIVVGGVAMYWNQILLTMGIVTPINPEKILHARENDEEEFVGVMTHTEDSDTNCIGTLCTATLYTYGANWFNETGRVWQRVNETWGPCPRGNGFCTNNYKFQASANSTGHVSFIVGPDDYTFTLRGANNITRFNHSIQSNGSEVSYPSLIANVLSSKYTFSLNQLKEEFVIESLPKFPQNINEFNLTVQKTGNMRGVLQGVIACDANANCMRLRYEQNATHGLIIIPMSFLRSRINYPVSVDPSILLNGTNVTYNVDLYTDINLTYTRDVLFPGSLSIGRNISANQSVLIHRVAIEFNISSIPANAVITEIMMNLTHTLLGTEGNELINFTNMEGSNITYSNDNDGNELFFNDMGNGTVYNTSNVSLGGFTRLANNLRKYNLTSSASDVMAARQTTDRFGYGIITHGEESVSGAQQANLIRSTAFSSPQFRPLLNVTYTTSICPPIGTKWVITTLCEINSGVYTVTHIDIISPGWLVLNTAQINGLKHLTMTAGARPAALTIKSGGFT